MTGTKWYRPPKSLLVNQVFGEIWTGIDKSVTPSLVANLSVHVRPLQAVKTPVELIVWDGLFRGMVTLRSAW